MKTDPIAERANEAHRLACVLRIAQAYSNDHGDDMIRAAGMLDEFVYLPALTTESRPEGLEREVVRLVVAARRVLESSDWASNIVERRERLGALDRASEAFASRVPWDDEPDATTTPHPQTNLQENLAGSQTDAPASGEVDTQLLQAIRDIGQDGQPVEVVLHSDGGWGVRTSDAAIAMREATPSERARDSALEEAAKVARAIRQWLVDQDDVSGSVHAYLSNRDDLLAAYVVAALRTAKPEQAGNLPADVARLVIAARELIDTGADDTEEGRAMLEAVEAFSSRVPYEDEPEHMAGFADTTVEQPERAGAGFVIGERVEKISGSSWRGRIVGTYSTTLTPEGYAVESDTEHGSVQIYPRKALRLLAAVPQGQNSGEWE